MISIGRKGVVEEDRKLLVHLVYGSISNFDGGIFSNFRARDTRTS